MFVKRLCVCVRLSEFVWLDVAFYGCGGSLSLCLCVCVYRHLLFAILPNATTTTKHQPPTVSLYTYSHYVSFVMTLSVGFVRTERRIFICHPQTTHQQTISTELPFPLLFQLLLVLLLVSQQPPPHSPASSAVSSRSTSLSVPDTRRHHSNPIGGGGGCLWGLLLRVVRWTPTP